MSQKLRYVDVVITKAVDEDVTLINLGFEEKEEKPEKKKFFFDFQLYEPWAAWNFGKLMRYCNDVMDLYELENQKITLMLDDETNYIVGFKQYDEDKCFWTGDAIIDWDNPGPFEMKDYTTKEAEKLWKSPERKKYLMEA